MQANFMSFLRALGPLFGAFFVGHSLFGHPITNELLDVLGGISLTLSTTLWGIFDKTTTVDQWSSAIRSIISAACGVFVSWGNISAQMAVEISGVVTAFLTFLQSAISKKTNKQIANGAIKAALTGKTENVIPPAK